MSINQVNNLGLDGFGFVEFTSPVAGLLNPVFESLGFVAVGHHRSKQVTLFRQGNIDLVLNEEPGSHAERFAAKHGPSACGMSFRVPDGEAAFSLAIERGAHAFDSNAGPMQMLIPAVKGIGGAPLYFVESNDKGAPQYEVEFDFVDDHENRSIGCGFHTIDHLTHNVFKGRLGHWSDFYEKLFDFSELRYFDIEGKSSGLQSRAMVGPDGKIRIPINEESGAGGGQIEEYLQEYNGEGIQHIALACDNLYECCERLAKNGLKFMPPPPSTYYEYLDERLPGHGEPLEKLAAQGILVDGSTDNSDPKLLLQIFSANAVGPIFFEFIQRKKDEGFGEGNFQALFESIERDQINRGVLSS